MRKASTNIGTGYQNEGEYAMINENEIVEEIECEVFSDPEVDHYFGTQQQRNNRDEEKDSSNVFNGDKPDSFKRQSR